MPVSPTYPGVYIEEIPSGVRTITGVATSITAFVGRALRGPVEDPITIYSYGEYERVFGGLWLESAMSYAVRDFFQNGGGQAVIVRLHKNATIAEYILPTGAAAPNNKLTLEAANPGSWGSKLSITIDYNTKTTDNNLFNVFVTDTINDTIEKHLNVSISSTDPRYVGRVLETSPLGPCWQGPGGVDIVPNVRPTRRQQPYPQPHIAWCRLTRRSR